MRRVASSSLVTGSLRRQLLHPQAAGFRRCRPHSHSQSNSHSHSHPNVDTPSLQTRSIWSYLSPNKPQPNEEEQNVHHKPQSSDPRTGNNNGNNINSKYNNSHSHSHSHNNNNNTMIAMPARQKQNANKPELEQDLLELLEAPVNTNTNIDDMTATGDTTITTLDSSAWLKAFKCLEYLVEQEDIPQAFRLLDRLVQEPDSKVRLNHDMVYMVIQQWLTVYSKQQRKIVQYPKPIYPPLTIWRKMEAYQRKGISLESRTYHRVIEGTALVRSKKSMNHHGPNLAETILERMMALSKHENPMIRPSTFTFNIVLASWEAAASLAPPSSNLSQQRAPERGLVLLEQLKTLYQTGWGNELMPDKNTYRRVMNLYAHKGDGDQVEALCEELYTLWLDHGHENENLLPTAPFFSLVLYAWSKSKDPDAAERALAILNHMLELEESKDVIPGMQVNAACFNIVMVCWSRLRTKESAIQVQALFDRLVELSKTDPIKSPIGGSYTALITTWSRLNAQKAEDAFWEWSRQHELGNCEMRLDAKLFGTLIGGWYNSKAPNSADRCDKLLQYALNAKMKTWEPTVVVFNMTINAYCRKKTVEGVERGEALLRQLENIRLTHKKSELRPTINTYVPIIHSWAMMGQVERAEELLREWFEHSQEATKDGSSSKKLQLDTRTFNYVLKAWLSKALLLPGAADRAEELLLSMPRLGVKPNSASFQHALDCRRKSRSGSKGYVKAVPRAPEVIALLDRSYKTGGLATSNDAYLTLRQAWSLLTI